MIRRARKCKCLNCSELFPPDHRNAQRQKYCSKKECRKASKANSQRKWLRRPENRNYFRGPENVQRVRGWRKDTPGYWRKSSVRRNTLQDRLTEKCTEKQTVTGPLKIHALQDSLSAQHTVLIGLIAHLTGNALQDDIAITTRRLQQLGSDILNNPDFRKGGSHGRKVSPMSTENTHSTQTVQLGGSPTGP